MRVYEVQYAKNDYSTDRSHTVVVASSAIRAAEFVAKRKWTGYSGRVTEVRETISIVNVAK